MNDDGKKKSILVSVTFGVIAFIVAFSLGSILTITTGIPLIGGLLNGILTGMVLTVGLLARRFFAAATCMWLAFSLCAIVTTTLGPPGIYKVAIGVTAGILWDLVYKISGYKFWGLLVGGVVGSASIMGTLLLFLSQGFGENAIEAFQKYQSNIYALLVINMVVTVLGVLLGHLLYNKRLKELTTFKNVSS